jgi:TM2 domain-containing membrane protein YozV
VGVAGFIQLHLTNPYIIAWWSAAFPGFGHLLLNKYLRGFALFIWEIVVNINAHVNIAMIYSFDGQFELAKQVLNPRWMLLYIPTYIFAIEDSYRTSVNLNNIFRLADHENAQINNFQISALEINYLDKRNPWVAVVWSLFMPGTGQLYIGKIVGAFFILAWTIIIVYFSNFLLGVHLFVLGHLNQAKTALNGEWLLFLPSLYFFAAYDAYLYTVEGNKLFVNEQKHFLEKEYQKPNFDLPFNVPKKTGE